MCAGGRADMGPVERACGRRARTYEIIVPRTRRTGSPKLTLSEKALGTRLVLKGVVRFPTMILETIAAFARIKVYEPPSGTCREGKGADHVRYGMVSS